MLLVQGRRRATNKSYCFVTEAVRVRGSAMNLDGVRAGVRATRPSTVCGSDGSRCGSRPAASRRSVDAGSVRGFVPWTAVSHLERLRGSPQAMAALQQTVASHCTRICVARGRCASGRFLAVPEMLAVCSPVLIFLQKCCGGSAFVRVQRRSLMHVTATCNWCSSRS